MLGYSLANYGLIKRMPSHNETANPACSTVAIIGKPGAVGIVRTLLDLAQFLQSTGRRVVFESETAVSLPPHQFPALDAQQIGQQADLAVVVGGDGTMLGIARQ